MAEYFELEVERGIKGPVAKTFMELKGVCKITFFPVVIFMIFLNWRTRTWNVWIFQTSLAPKMGRALGNIAVEGWACQR